MAEEFNEYATFTITNKAGENIELAVVDEFEFEHKQYVVGALIEGDAVNEEALFIYRAKVTEDDFTVEKITNAIDYERISQAYLDME